MRISERERRIDELFIAIQTHTGDAYNPNSVYEKLDRQAEIMQIEWMADRKMESGIMEVLRNLPNVQQVRRLKKPAGRQFWLSGIHVMFHAEPGKRPKQVKIHPEQSEASLRKLIENLCHSEDMGEEGIEGFLRTNGYILMVGNQDSEDLAKNFQALHEKYRRKHIAD